MPIQLNMTDYRSTAESFTWQVPEYYNFVLDDFDRWSGDRTKIALTTVSPDGKQASRLTFRDLSVLSCQFANVLKELGIQRGDRVFLMLPRSEEWYIAVLGMIRAGVVAMPTPNMVTGHDIEYRFSRTEAVMAVTDAEGAGKIDAVADKLPWLKTKVITGENRKGWLSFDDLLEKAPRRFDPGDFGGTTKSSDPMLIYFTSGTTGNPKMVRHTQSYAIAHTVTARYIQNLRSTDIIWVHADTGWAKTAYGKLFGQWIEGATVLQWQMGGRFEPKYMPEIIERYGVSVMCAPPTAYRMLVGHLDLSKYDWSELKHALSAGEPLNPDVIRAWKEQTGLTIYDYYGQTETIPVVANFQSMPVKEGSMGVPTPGYDVEVVDDEGNVLSRGTEGNIAIRVKPFHPPGVFQGYWRDEESTPFVGDWYFTGDRAYRDEGGYFWFVGRADDLIKSSGYRIGPFEVESALQEHPAVLESAVIGVPDDLRGQLVKAFVVLAPGYEESPDLVKELQDHVMQVTAPYKYPRIIDFVKELPKTISGKVRRVELRAREKASGGPDVHQA
ncbi:MAG: acyl-CoA synthetase [delta proteobacterium MLS_D]|jgi:acyl-coenzyme A synthetase/AMP-(fatty) acid ligase|nr:MAG: acyl-CoA synthetase [delta proteobacterium MLS_D]